MKMILKLTPGDDSMVQLWTIGGLLAGVIHIDCFDRADFLDKLRSGEEIDAWIEEIQ